MNGSMLALDFAESADREEQDRFVAAQPGERAQEDIPLHSLYCAPGWPMKREKASYDQ